MDEFSKNPKQVTSLLGEPCALRQQNNSTAVAVFSFNRPRYLNDVLRCLEANSEIADLDFYLVQDGAINRFSNRIAARNEDIEQCISLWENSTLPNKHVVKYQFNVGIGIIQFETKELLFETLGYSHVLFFEDDLIVCKNYIRLLRVMLRQYAADNNVGAVMCHGGHPRSWSEEEKHAFIYSVRAGNHGFWGWATWNDRWNKIKPTFLKYYKFIYDIDYRKRPTQLIREFYTANAFSMDVTSQDAAMHYALFTNGFIALNTFIHRGKYIGEIGEHMNPFKYENIGFSNVVLEEFSQDREVNRFDEYDKIQAMEFMKSLFGKLK